MAFLGLTRNTLTSCFLKTGRSWTYQLLIFPLMRILLFHIRRRPLQLASCQCPVVTVFPCPIIKSNTKQLPPVLHKVLSVIQLCSSTSWSLYLGLICCLQDSSPKTQCVNNSKLPLSCEAGSHGTWVSTAHTFWAFSSERGFKGCKTILVKCLQAETSHLSLSLDVPDWGDRVGLPSEMSIPYFVVYPLKISLSDTYISRCSLWSKGTPILGKHTIWRKWCKNNSWEN